MGGLVAISFWSMVVSATSGIIGRYFYVQLLSKKSDVHRIANGWDEKLGKYQKLSSSDIQDHTMELLKKSALIFVGAPANQSEYKDISFFGLIIIFLKSFLVQSLMQMARNMG